jgi:pimeloyl-ACP methyl ester carboxylesterase
LKNNTILVHGLEQSAQSWNKTMSYFPVKEKLHCPDLFSLSSADIFTYTDLYNRFADYCNSFGEPINLCGLSLGAILALNYAIDYPDIVPSLVLIAARYKMPKMLLSFQNAILKLMPESINTGSPISKTNLLNLTKSMSNIDFSEKLIKVKAKTLVLCGAKDLFNKAHNKELSKKIHGAKFATIKNSGHIVNEENPALLAEKMKEFLCT